MKRGGKPPQDCSTWTAGPRKSRHERTLLERVLPSTRATPKPPIIIPPKKGSSVRLYVKRDNGWKEDVHQALPPFMGISKTGGKNINNSLRGKRLGSASFHFYSKYGRGQPQTISHVDTKILTSRRGRKATGDRCNYCRWKDWRRRVINTPLWEKI